MEKQRRIQSVVSQFRNYDKAVFDWLSSVPTNDDGSPVPVVMATPDRAFSAINILLRERGITTGDNSPKNIPLPFISVASNTLELDPNRYHGPVDYVLGATKDNSSVFHTKHPLPWNISYRAEFWSKNMESMNVFKLWLATSFNEGYETMIPADLSNVWPKWTKKLIPVDNEGARFVGIAEPEEGHRVNRMAADFTLKAWITPTILETKNIHQIITDIYSAKKYVDLGSATSEDIANTDIFDRLDTVVVE